MELTLMRQVGTRINAICDGQLSHSFDLRLLLLKTGEEIFANPVAYGKQLYEALFPPHTPAHYALATLLGAMPGGLLLVTGDDDLDAIPWEYAYGPDGFLVQECHVARGLSVDQRLVPPTLDTGMHIIAVPSNPLSHQVESLNLDGEWLRLKETIQELPFAITLERTRPPSLERLRQLVATHRHRVVHFMGHGGQDEKAGAILCFEKDNGDLDSVTAKDFMRRVRGTVFLVTLNACASATPGPTAFNNLAAALVRQKVPYALGMRFSIVDEDARAFSRTFYSDLARGASVEEALRQARLTLAKSPRPWAVGVPVLYTSLTQTAAGFAASAGSPTIQEQQPHVEVSMLSRAEGTFQGRTDELKQLGTALTGDNRPPLITIHGGGGQGKTALAREAVERFAYAWPGGVWAISLENLPSRELFVSDLARFLGINTQKVVDPKEVERLVMAQLALRRTLIVLDNAETLVEAVKANNEAAVRLAQFLREQVPRPPVSLLATSRSFLGWASEVGCELRGLTPMEGVRLFRQYAPEREREIDRTLVWELSKKMEGHPLGLQLLGGAFDASSIPFSAFVEDYEEHLLRAEDKYKDADHRHRTLYASIEASVRYLNSELRALFGGLRIFHAPFLPETAAAIFDPTTGSAENEIAAFYDQLHMLWHRGLLARERAITNDGVVLHYRLLPVVRSYLERYLDQTDQSEVLLAKFGAAYAQLASFLYRELDYQAAAVYISRQGREDLERGISYTTGESLGSYVRHWGWILYRLGDPQRGLKLIEQALEVSQGQDRKLEEDALNNIAAVYDMIGQRQQALALYEQALLIAREMNNRNAEAAVLNNMASVYSALGQWKQALTLYEQALLIARETNNRKGEAPTLNNMALIFSSSGRQNEALALYQQALLIQRELGNRADQATTLTNIADLYHKMGQSQQALELHQQALAIQREMGDRAGEAVTLANLAAVYRDTGQLQQALALYEQALLIVREVSDRPTEGAILNNKALVYRAIGEPQQALACYEQALPITREVGDREGEANTLASIARVHQTAGQLQRALEFYQQTLAIQRGMEDRTSEASTLANIARVHHLMGRLGQALALYEQVLPMTRELSDRPGEATILTDMAGAHRTMGQLQPALEFYQQALTIQREVSDRSAEATTLKSMARVYQDTGQSRQELALYEQILVIARKTGDRTREATALTDMARVHYAMGQPQRALELYEQVLPIWKEVSNHLGEAITLNSMAAVYHKIGQLQQALEFYQQALHLRHEVSDRAGEATTLTNMAQLYLRMEQPQQALLLYQQALPIRREISDRAGEVATLANIALVLYRHLGRPQEAIAQVEQAITVLVNAGLSQDAAGQTLEDLREILRTMRRGDQLSTMTIDLPSLRAGRLQQIVTNTIAVMTVAHDYRHAWRKAMADELQQAQQGGADSQPQADFFTAILALLDGNSPILPADRPYAHTLAKIQEGIAKGGLPNDDTAQNDDSPFDADLIPRSIAALLGGPQGKMAHAQYLNTISTQAADEGLKAFLQTIQLGLFGGDLSQFGQNLRGVYRKAWGMIIMGVETGSINPGLIEIIVHNTRAVLGSASDKRDEWRSALTQMRNQAMEEDTSELVALLDAVIGLLDAKGNPIGLGTNLTGVYAQIWQAIVERIA